MALAKRKIRTVSKRLAKPTAAIELGSTTLKKAGGSLVMTMPATARDALKLSEGQKLSIILDGDTLVLRPAKRQRPKYTLEQLLAECDLDAEMTDEEREWLNAPPAGREI